MLLQKPHGVCHLVVDALAAAGVIGLLEALQRDAVLIQKPAFNGADHAVHDEIIDQLRNVIHPKQILHPHPEQRPNKLPEMGSKGILSVHLQNPTVEGSVFTEIVAKDLDVFPAVIKAVTEKTHIQIELLIQLHEFRVEDPVHQIIFIPEMIVEALAVHAAPLADIRNADFFKRLLLQQFLQRIG